MARRVVPSVYVSTSSRFSRYELAKSALDLAICLAVLPVAVVVMLIIAIAVYVDSGWPVLFVQERIGRDGRPFRMYKFRTLRRDYDSEQGREYMRAYVRGKVGHHVDQRGPSGGQQVFKPIAHSHVTRLGRILRRTSLDELPQIFNVIRGEMSLVGPRPNVPWEVAAYKRWHHQRLKVLPGITGLAQVRGRSSISFDDIVRCDLEYIRKRSLRLDLKILWWTALSVARRQGAH